MTGGFNTSGFTIVETLIVLAITGILLLSAMYTLSGKTGQGEFTQAINGIKSNLQQIINNSSDDIYPNEGAFPCSLTSTGTISLKDPTSSINCTFLGRMINFNNPSLSAGTLQNYTVYTIIGQQCAVYSSGFSSGCSVPTTWQEAGPYILPASTKTQLTQTLLNGISLYSITLKNSGNSLTVYDPEIPLTSIGFLANPATNASASSPTADSLSPGALQLSVYGYYTITPVAGSMTTTDLIEENEVDLCFASATTNQSAEIILDGTDAQAIVSLQIYGGLTC